MPSVLIADDSALIRERLVELIADLDDISLVGQATTVAEAIALARQHHPDVVILDICMPGGSGIDALQAIKKITPACVIMLTAYPYPQYRTRCLKLGADHFLDKNTEFEQVVQVLKPVFQEQEQ